MTTPAPSPTPDPPRVLVGAGEIHAQCNSNANEATAALVDGLDGTVFTLGDNAGESGTAEEYRCYEQSWGRHRARTRPAVGNHDYVTAGAGAYFAYFGDLAGEPDKGYYSYDLGTWHIVVLNSNCGEVGGCRAGSRQEQWLRADLAAHPARCTLAYWHQPRFSSGIYGTNSDVRPFWEALYEAGAEVVLNGHEKLYERFAPQDPSARLDPTLGIRQFTVGTGGDDYYKLQQVAANSQVRNNETRGVLKFALGPTSYDWEFIPVAGQTFTDAGSDACH